MAQKLSISIFVVVILNALSTNSALIVPSILKENGAIPFAASLRTNSHFCGASIISEQWIITAAHCFKEKIIQSKVKAVVGTDVHNKGGVSYDIESIVIHPKYNNLSKSEYDIALIKTVEPIKMDGQVSVIPMSKEPITSIGNDVYTESWVPTRSQRAPLKMEFKKLITVSNEYAAKVLKFGYGKSIHRAVISAVPENRVGNHRTVSGGALIANDMLVGVASWAVINSAGKPELFTGVSMYSSWIQNVTGIELY